MASTKKYVTTTNAAGQTIHTTWRVWRGGEHGTGYTSFADENEAWRHYTISLGARLDRIDTVVIDMRPD